jgi:hypothetical protein
VAGSNALHHVPPELVPPVGREYTLQFFYDHKMLQSGECQTFTEIFPKFHRILWSCKEEIRRRLRSAMNISSTKVMDNADERDCKEGVRRIPS